ncbi:hypothetical protein MHTCC0001_15960 [Flavobacteriaceae bacterium MHTCC 0001]
MSREDQADLLNISIDTLNNWEYRKKEIPEHKIKNVTYVLDMYKKTQGTKTTTKPPLNYGVDSENPQTKTDLVSEYKNNNYAQRKQIEDIIADRVVERLSAKMDAILEALDKLSLAEEKIHALSLLLKAEIIKEEKQKSG